MRFGNYSEYLNRRWKELGGEEATDAVRRRLGIFREQDMGWGNPDTHPQAEARAEEFKWAQMPIFVRIAGELHHVLGHRDVGLGKKNSGNRWELEGDDVATDILVLKDLDGGPDDQLVDCFSSMGGPETKPSWNEIEPNADRTFVVPPKPSGDVPPVTGDSGDAQQPVGSRLVIDLAPIVSELLKPLEKAHEEMRQRLKALEERPASQPSALPKRIALVDSQGNYVSADRNRGNILVADRPSRGTWEVFEPEPVE